MVRNVGSGCVGSSTSTHRLDHQLSRQPISDEALTIDLVTNQSSTYTMPYGYVFGAGSECVFTFLTRVVSLIRYWVTSIS